MVKTRSFYLTRSWSGTVTLRTDGQTDRQNYRS